MSAPNSTTPSRSGSPRVPNTETHTVWLEVVDKVEQMPSTMNLPSRRQARQREDSQGTTVVGSSVRSTPAVTPLNSERKRDQKDQMPVQPKKIDPQDVVQQQQQQQQWPPLVGWFVDVLGPKPAGPKKPRRRRLKHDSRPPWNDTAGRAPLTHPSGPHAQLALQRATALRTAQDPAANVRPAASHRGDSRRGHGQRVTSSPTGRQAASLERRQHVREADMMSMIEYFSQGRGAEIYVSKRADAPLGGYISEIANRETARSGWIPSQAWTESLRYYPGKAEAKVNGDSPLCYSGKTHTVRRVPSEHLESDVRTRVGLAAADPEWRPEQLHQTWAPNMDRPDMRRRLDKTVHGLLTTREPSPQMRADYLPSYLDYTKALGERKKLAAPKVAKLLEAKKPGKAGAKAVPGRATQQTEVKL